jgi:hypothetical protein
MDGWMDNRISIQSLLRVYSNSNTGQEQETRSVAEQLFIRKCAGIPFQLGFGPIHGVDATEIPVRGGGAAPARGCGRVHPAPREEEPERVARDGGEEHADVEGHDGQHEEVGEAHPGRVRHREQRRRRRWRAPAAAVPRRGAPGDAARHGGERLGRRGEARHEEEAEDVRARAALAGPPREQHHRAVSPEEGHVHQRRPVPRRGLVATVRPHLPHALLHRWFLPKLSESARLGGESDGRKPAGRGRYSRWDVYWNQVNRGSSGGRTAKQVLAWASFS